MFDNIPAPRADVPRETKLISQYHRLCNLPSRTVQPYPFSCYGSQQRPASNVFYRTSSLDYGWYPPTIHTLPVEYFPMSQHFSNELYKAGMYRNHSLNTGTDRCPF